jgi:hypothetical protein
MLRRVFLVGNGGWGGERNCDMEGLTFYGTICFGKTIIEKVGVLSRGGVFIYLTPYVPLSKLEIL